MQRVTRGLVLAISVVAVTLHLAIQTEAKGGYQHHAPKVHTKTVSETQAVEVPPTFSCPHNFDIQEGADTCSRKVTKDVLYQCPDDFTFDRVAHLCVRKVSAAILQSCSPPYKLLSGLCRANQVHPEEYYCPSGYQQSSSNVCSREIQVNASPQCVDPGYLLKGGMCERTISVKAIEYCPEKYTFDASTRKCISMDIQASISVCPEGTTPNQGRCVSQITIPARQECTNGFHMQMTQRGVLCVKKQSLIRPTACSGDAIPNSRGDCILERMIPAKLECGEGFELDENQECFKVIRKQPKRICPSGIVPRGDQCPIQEQVLSVVSCPPGFRHSPATNSCDKEDHMAPQTLCPQGYFLSSLGICTKLVEHQPQPNCPTGYEYNNGTCIKPTYASVLVKCPRGYQKLNGECVTHESMRPDMTCPVNFNLSGSQCLQQLTAPMKDKCPTGTRRLATGQCVVEVQADPDQSCPSGLRMNPRSGDCESVDSVPPQAKCPKGLPMEKGMCTTIESKPAQRQCPKGAILNTGKNVCVRYQTVTKEVVVPAPQLRTSKGSQIISANTKASYNISAPRTTHASHHY